MSVSALSSSSLDSGSTPSSKGVSQFPSISTLTAIKPAQNIEASTKLQEPDVIASTKTSTATCSSMIKAPVAPPRRKKKNKDVGSLNLTVSFYQSPQKPKTDGSYQFVEELSSGK